MSRPARLPAALAACALAGLLAACTQPAPPAPAEPAAPAPVTGIPAPAPPAAACDAAKSQWAIGQALDEALLERARVDAGAATVRSLKPDQVVTMEFNAERLNVDVDADGTVTGVRCG